MIKIIQEKREISRNKDLISLPLGKFIIGDDLYLDDVIEILDGLQEKEKCLAIKKIWIKNPQLYKDIVTRLRLSTILGEAPIERDGEFLFSLNYQYNPKDEIICKIKKEFDALYKKLKKLGGPRKQILKSESTTDPKIKSSYLITRDSEGNFYYKNKLIDFQNKDAIYYKVFEAVFMESNGNGFCSYERIDKFLEKSGEDKLDDVEKIRKRINNAVDNLFRFTKNLPYKAPNGKQIITIQRGKGLVFFNPQI